MRSRFDGSETNIEGIVYDVEMVMSQSQSKDVTDQVLYPSRGRGKCDNDTINLEITLQPGPRQSNMLISIEVKGASSVSLVYTYGSTSSPITVSVRHGRAFPIIYGPCKYESLV